MAVGWPRFPQDHPEITGRSMGINKVIFLDPIAAKDASIWAHFSHADNGREMTPENMVFLAESRRRKGGRPGMWRIGHDFPMVARISRAIHWQLTGSSFWTLIAAMDA